MLNVQDFKSLILNQFCLISPLKKPCPFHQMKRFQKEEKKLVKELNSRQFHGMMLIVSLENIIYMVHFEIEYKLY